MKRAKTSTDVRTRPSPLRRWILVGTLATTAAGAALLLTFARLQAGKAVWTDGFYLSGDQWFDAARTTVTLVGIIGLGGAAFLAYRKQVSTEASHLLEQSTSLRNRYTTAAEQLGHDSAAIRLAGVYALASLADDWLEFGQGKETQVCVDLLCAYLRVERSPSRAELPRAATPSSRVVAGRRRPRLAPTARARVGHEEGNVRSAVVGVIRTRAWSWRGWVVDRQGGLHLALNGADLAGANLAGADLSGADLSGANLSDANLSGANLYGADLSRANLSRAKLDGADLSHANLDGADLSRAKLDRADLSHANLDWANLDRADLTSANLFSATLYSATLRRADLSDVKLSRAFLLSAFLSGADLSSADLSGAELPGAELPGANLSGVDLSGTDVSYADLSGADLSGTDLSGTDLSGTDVSCAFLSRANLSGANLSSTDLSRADLSGADLSGADLEGANLSDVTHTAETRWPEGFVLPELSAS